MISKLRAWEKMNKKDQRKEDVVELQMRLAGFRGTEPGGDFGPDTELQMVSPVPIITERPSISTYPGKPEKIGVMI
jgi:hypothetical protein